MTDERIKEEYDGWVCDGECTESEKRFFAQYPAENHPTAVGFYAGFRTAERLAKIEALEEVLKRWENMYCQDRESRETAVRSMIAELKEAKR